MLTTLLLALAQPSAEAALPGPVWAAVEREPALQHVRTKLEFGTLGVVRGRPSQLLYFVRQTISGFRHPLQVRWADSQTCPALVQVLDDLRAVPIPRIDLPGFPHQPGGTDGEIVLDGVGYNFNLGARLSFSTNVGSGLARWTEASLTRLSSCWRDEPPAARR